MTKAVNFQGFWEGFAKYVGIQGVMALALVLGFVYTSVNQITLNDLYTNVMTLIVGYYFAKNGVGILAALSGFKK